MVYQGFFILTRLRRQKVQVFALSHAKFQNLGKEPDKLPGSLPIFTLAHKSHYRDMALYNLCAL